MDIETVMSDYLNGNLTAAKEGAKDHSTFRISMFARQKMFYSFDKAVGLAAFLKGELSWDEYCSIPNDSFIHSGGKHSN